MLKSTLFSTFVISINLDLLSQKWICCSTRFNWVRMVYQWIRSKRCIMAIKHLLQMWYCTILGVWWTSFGGTNYNYKVESNKESGHGRYDLQLSPHYPNAGKRSIIFEFKVLREIRSEDYSAIESKLCSLAEDGLNQIQIRQYHISVPNWCTEVYECGVAFYKKYCVILSRQLLRHSAEQNWSILSSDIWTHYDSL